MKNPFTFDEEEEETLVSRNACTSWTERLCVPINSLVLGVPTEFSHSPFGRRGFLPNEPEYIAISSSIAYTNQGHSFLVNNDHHSFCGADNRHHHYYNHHSVLETC